MSLLSGGCSRLLPSFVRTILFSFERPIHAVEIIHVIFIIRQFWIILPLVTFQRLQFFFVRFLFDFFTIRIFVGFLQYISQFRLFQNSAFIFVSLFSGYSLAGVSAIFFLVLPVIRFD